MLSKSEIVECLRELKLESKETESIDLKQISSAFKLLPLILITVAISESRPPFGHCVDITQLLVRVQTLEIIH